MILVRSWRHSGSTFVWTAESDIDGTVQKNQRGFSKLKLNQTGLSRVVEEPGGHRRLNFRASKRGIPSFV
jgi:hypothetical protein